MNGYVIRGVGQGNYEIIAGERRWRAAQIAGLSTVPCIICDYDDEKTAAITLIENIQREDLNPIEEAKALKRLVCNSFIIPECSIVVFPSTSIIKISFFADKFIP